MTAQATFAHRFVLEDKRAALRGMTLETGLVVTEQRGTAALQTLRQIRAAAFNGVAFVRVVAISTAHFALEHRMVMRKIEFRFHFQMALETGRWRLARIDDRAFIAAALHVETSWAVARFAADVLRVVALRLQTRVGRGRKTFRDCFVAGRAFFRADEFRAGNAGRREERAARFEVAARKQDYG